MASADGGAGEALHLLCSSGWCPTCHGRRLYAVAQRAIAGFAPGGMGYFLTFTPRVRIQSQEEAQAFLLQVQRAVKALARTDRDTVLQRGMWVAEWVRKPEEEPTREPCPVCRTWGHRPDGTGRLWVDDAGACVVCAGARFLPAGHLHVHVLAQAERPFWWARVPPGQVQPPMSGWTWEERAWMLGPEGAAARGKRGADIHPLVVRWRRETALYTAAQLALRDGWPEVPGGGGLWAIADRYGLGHTDVQVVRDIDEDGRSLARYLGKLVGYVAKGSASLGDAAAFRALVGSARRVAAFGLGREDESEAGDAEPLVRAVAVHRRVWSRGVARLQRSGLSPWEQALPAVRDVEAVPVEGDYIHAGERWRCMPVTPRAWRAFCLDSVDTTKSPTETCGGSGGAGEPPPRAALRAGPWALREQHAPTESARAARERRGAAAGVSRALQQVVAAHAGERMTRCEPRQGEPRPGAGWACVSRRAIGWWVALVVTDQGVPMQLVADDARGMARAIAATLRLGCVIPAGRRVARAGRRGVRLLRRS